MILMMKIFIGCSPNADMFWLKKKEKKKKPDNLNQTSRQDEGLLVETYLNFDNFKVIFSRQNTNLTCDTSFFREKIFCFIF